MCVHLAHELAVHGWVAPCVRRGGAGAGRAGQRASVTRRGAARRDKQFPLINVLTSRNLLQVFVDFMNINMSPMTKTDDSATSIVNVK